MICAALRLARRYTQLACILVSSVSVLSAAEERFTTPPGVASEAMTLIQLFEQLHYSRDKVGTDYSSVIPDYMGDLDGQRLFFLNSDKAKFMQTYAKNVYYNVRFVGNIDAAYDIFYTYQTRVQSRVKWVFDELNKDQDFSTNETYRVDRSKSEWPADMAAADDLWRRRLKYELITEMLATKAKDTKQLSTTFGPTDAAKSADDTARSTAAASAPAAGATGTTEKSDVTTPDAAKPADKQAVAANDDPKAKLDKAREKVRKRYERMLKNLSEIDQNDLTELYLSTIARQYDPHSTYFSPSTFEDFAIQMKLQLVGIGALLGLEDDNCIVKEIVPGGPADVGRELKAGDKIISVAQTGHEPVEVIGMKLRNIVQMIRGQKGTQVHLTVEPADAADSSARRDVVITRDVVKLNAQRARAAVFQLPDSQGKTQPIGVITLPAFYGPSDDGDTDTEKTSASKDVARLIAILKQQNVQGLVLDLRHNGGGYLTEAIELAGLFITKGPVVQVKNYNGEIHADDDDDPSVAYSGPLAVLVDRFSASASEIVTGALQNYGRAVIVGDSSTHGKGTVQQVIELKVANPSLAIGGQKVGAAKFTIQKYYLPSGASTQLKGVIPDIILPTIDDYIPNIGEADLPRAMAWDQIPTSYFDGQPLKANFIQPLREASRKRQASLEEFTFLRKNVEWFKERQQQKLISVNLSQRQHQKTDDDTFRKEMKAEREQVAKSDYAFKPIYLGTPPVPKAKAAKKDSDTDDFDDELEENETYIKADVHLRESLRVVSDAITLGRNRDLWVSNHPPVTVAVANPPSTLQPQ